MKYQRIGTQTSLIKGVSGIFCAVLRRCADRVEDKNVAAKEKKRRTGGSGIKMSDAEITEARRAYENGEMTARELSERYGVSFGYMHHVLAY